MACLNISTNVALDGIDTSSILSDATSTVANLLGKPESVKQKKKMSAEATQKSGPPKIVASVTAFKLAEQWVKNMSKVEMDQPKNIESEGRPSRLGLGAKFAPQLRPRPSNDPVEKRLFSQFEFGKRKAAKESEELRLPAKDSDSEGEPESRAASFSKKRAPTPAVTSPTKKKRK